MNLDKKQIGKEVLEEARLDLNKKMIDRGAEDILQLNIEIDPRKLNTIFKKAIKLTQQKTAQQILSYIYGCHQYHDQYGKCTGKGCITCKILTAIEREIKKEWGDL